MKIFFRSLIVSTCLVISLQAAEYGPLNGEFKADGIYGLRESIDSKTITKADAAWSFNFWINPRQAVASKTLLGGFGDLSNTKGEQRYLAVFDDHVRFWGASVDVPAKATLITNKWQMLTATYDGTTLKIYQDGEELVAKPITLTDAKPEMNVAPMSPWNDGGHLGGRIALFTLWDKTLTVQEIKALTTKLPPDNLIYAKGKPKSWDPKHTTTAFGLREPQKPDQLPQSNAKPQPPSAPKPPTKETLTANPDGSWQLAGPWKLAEAPKVTANGETLSKPGFKDNDWYPATVPGTVLTTLVDQGVYPDPFHGLNNLSIPETLNKQDYWYRLEFDAPKDCANRHSALTFNGINYAAEIWLNGKQLGGIKGAFIRGDFDVTGSLLAGQKNVLAVKVSPPPHPGIPHEQSIKAGAGPNGGAMTQDGPTFFCSEGWDWIPGIRDRNTGIWQDVVLKVTDSMTIGDPQVITRIPDPVGSRADVSIEVALKNLGNTAQSGTLTAAFEGVTVQKNVTINANRELNVSLSPQEFPQLAVANPRLWWPNGYGKPELYHLTLTFIQNGKVSDIRKTRFGMREVSVVITALNPQQKPQRYQFFPAAARATEVVKHDHESLVSSPQGWVPTIADGDKLPGLLVTSDTDTGRYLEVRVNNVRIPMRGGNWGMDDGMKRVSRERLEPYLRLQRDANFNILRNWCGQSTSEALFDLCDEYGIMVMNEFWISTQWSNLEPLDNDLFLANAADAIKRFRIHPSIVFWSGRNEGVPPAPINEGLDKLIRTLDGTRYYQPASITINIEGSGPWKYIEPVEYFQKKGFTTELGLPSPLTADAIRAFIPQEDLWPPNDTWGYHDWLDKGAMDVKTFMQAIASQIGEPTDFADYERKAQMINYTSHRAMYEGLNANLWSPNTGRLLWMSHPSWPSFVWQIYGHDYQPNAAFYGIRKGCEPIHVQMNLPDYTVQVTNTTLNTLPKAKITAKVYNASSELVSTKDAMLDVPVNSSAKSFMVDPAVNQGLNFVALELRDANGLLLSQNFYWRSPKPEDLMALNQLPKVTVDTKSSVLSDGQKTVVTLELQNNNKSVALMIFLTLRNARDGQRILPAYTSDNYLSLLPGEKRSVSIECPHSLAGIPLQVTVDGWNVNPSQCAVK
jgi:hypothetical protein